MVGLAALIIVSAVAAYRIMGDFLTASHWVAHSHDVIQLLDELDGLVAEAETAVRGYVITGRREYLAPYEAARSRVEQTTARLADEVADNPEQLDRAQRLAPAVAAKMANLEETATLRRTEGVNAAVQAVSRDQGKALMDALRAQIQDLRAEEVRLVGERERRTADELRLAKEALFLASMLVIGLLATAIALVTRDINRTEHDLEAESTAHRDSLTVLDERAEETRAVRDSIIDAIITIDERGTIQSANNATERLFGYGAAELLGQNVNLLMPSPYREEHDSYLANYRATARRKIIGIGREVSGCRKDGTTFPIDLAVSEARVGGRRLFTGVVRDLSDRKRAEGEIRELQRLVQERARMADIGAVAAQIVHDIGNPIAGLSMQAQRLVRVARRNPEQPVALVVPEIAEQILRGVGRLDGMLQELRDFSRQQRLELVPIDLMRFLVTVREHWNAVAATRGIQLRIERHGEPSSAMVDEPKLLRVLDNLVKNAIEAIEDGPGEVCLTVTASDSARHPVRLSVSDNGPGIPETLDVFRLFETTKRDGCGLGLPIACRIVEAHGGVLSFARCEPHGTIFHIDLPLGASGGPETLRSDE